MNHDGHAFTGAASTLLKLLLEYSKQVHPKSYVGEDKRSHPPSWTGGASRLPYVGCNMLEELGKFST